MTHLISECCKSSMTLNKNNPEITGWHRYLCDECTNGCDGITQKSLNYQLVQMNLRPKTYERLMLIKERLRAENRTETVKRCLEITDIISKAIATGGRVIIEESDGSRTKLILPGL